MSSRMPRGQQALAAARPSYFRIHDRTLRSSPATSGVTIGMTCSVSCSTGSCTGAGIAPAPVCSEMKRHIRLGASLQSPRPHAASAGARGTCRNPIPFRTRELRSEVIDLQIDREINPTDGHLSDAFERLNDDHGSVYADAQMAFDIAARREVSQDDFGLEPLGLAMWSAKLP